MVNHILPLRLENVCVKKRGKTLLGPVNLEIGSQGITTVLGPNGSGKTTLLRAIHGLERLADGALHWQQDISIVRASQAFVFQSPIMLRRTTLENLSYPLKISGAPIKEREIKAKETLEKVDLSDCAMLSALQLSGGEQQKLAIARALITTPQLLLLDEPTTNLDGRATKEIEALLLEAAKSGVRILVSTHDTAQAKRLANDTLFLYRGRIHERGSAAQFFKKPKTSEAQSYLRGDILE